MIYLFIGALLFIQAKSQPCDSRANCTNEYLPACIKIDPDASGSCLDCETNTDCELRPGDETICEYNLCINATVPTTTMYSSTSAAECSFQGIPSFNCTLAGRVCDTDSAECVVCRDSTDCQNSLYFGVPSGYGTTCDLYVGFGNLCFTSCSEDTDCPGEYSLTPYCDTTGRYPGQCVNCNNNDDCEFGEICDSNGICNEPTTTAGPTTTEFICNNDTECSFPTPYCMYGDCSECKNDTTCDDGYICEYASGGYECVIEPTTTPPPIDCTSNSDCPDYDPVCMKNDYVCGQCNNATDCGDGYQCRWGGYNSFFQSYCEPIPTTPADQTIGNVTCGDTREGTIDSSNLADYYFFTLDDTYDVVISTCNDGFTPTLTDTVLYLYDATGEIELFEDDEGGCGSLSEIAEQLDAGEYIIGVAPYLSSYSGDYSVSITCSTPEPTTTEEMTTAAPINVSLVMDRIGCGSLVNGSVSFNDQNDYYYLMLNETTVVNVTTCVNAADFTLLDDSEIRIYDEEGVELYDSGIDFRCGGKATIVVELEAGKYIVGVNSYDEFRSGEYYLLTTCSEPLPITTEDDGLPDPCYSNSDCADDEQCRPIDIGNGIIAKFCVPDGLELCIDDEDCLPGLSCFKPDGYPSGACIVADVTTGCTIDGDECGEDLTCYNGTSDNIDNFCYLLCEDAATDCGGSDDYICGTDTETYEPAEVTTCVYAKVFTDEPSGSPTMEPTTSEPTESPEDDPEGVAGLAIFGGMVITIIHSLFM